MNARIWSPRVRVIVPRMRSGKLLVAHLFGILSLAAISLPAAAQNLELEKGAEDSPPARAWTIVPNLSVQETFSDNATLGASGSKKSDWVTDVSPGIRVEGRTSRLKIYADYSLHQVFYANGSRGDQTQNSLNAFGTFEAIEKFFFVDMSGVVTQQNVSAFGTQSAANYSANSNSTETSNFRFSPYLRGKFAGYVDYEARYSKTSMRTKSNVSPSSDNDTWSGRISGDTSLANLGWSMDADRQNVDFKPGRSTDSEHWRGTLNYRIDNQVTLSVSGGRERNNYAGPEMQTSATHGFGFDWRPTERAQISAFKEKRFFGDGHSITVSNRMQQSAIKYTDSRDVSIMSQSSFMTMFDLLYSLNAWQYQSPAEATAKINSVLAAAKIAPNTLSSASLVSGQASIQRRQELSYVLLGVRNTLTLMLVKSQTRGINSLLLAGFDLSTTQSITQQGGNISWSHRLSGLSSLDIVGTMMHNTSDSDLNLKNTQKALSVAVSTRLGAKTRGSVTARHTVFSSSLSPYTENALAGMVSVDF